MSKGDLLYFDTAWKLHECRARDCDQGRGGGGGGGAAAAAAAAAGVFCIQSFFAFNQRSVILQRDAQTLGRRGREKEKNLIEL